MVVALPRSVKSGTSADDPPTPSKKGFIRMYSDEGGDYLVRLEHVTHVRTTVLADKKRAQFYFIGGGQIEIAGKNAESYVNWLSEK
jgi:hypothetical protein